MERVHKKFRPLQRPTTSRQAAPPQVFASSQLRARRVNVPHRQKSSANVKSLLPTPLSNRSGNMPSRPVQKFKPLPRPSHQAPPIVHAPPRASASPQLPDPVVNVPHRQESSARFVEQLAAAKKKTTKLIRRPKELVERRECKHEGCSTSVEVVTINDGVCQTVYGDFCACHHTINERKMRANLGEEEPLATGPWTEEEESLLKLGYKHLGVDPELVARLYVRTRCPLQVRNKIETDGEKLFRDVERIIRRNNRTMKSILDHNRSQLFDEFSVDCPYKQTGLHDQISSLIESDAPQDDIKKLLNENLSQIAEGDGTFRYHHCGQITAEGYAKHKMNKVYGVPYAKSANANPTVSEEKKRGLKYCADMVIEKFGKVQFKVGSTGDTLRCWGSSYDPITLQSFGTVLPIPLGNDELGEAEFFVMDYLIKKGLSSNQVAECSGSTPKQKDEKVGFIYVVPTLCKTLFHFFVAEAEYRYRVTLASSRALSRAQRESPIETAPAGRATLAISQAQRESPIETAPAGRSFSPIGMDIGESFDSEEEDDEDIDATISNTRAPTDSEEEEDDDDDIDATISNTRSPTDSEEEDDENIDATISNTRSPTDSEINAPSVEYGVTNDEPRTVSPFDVEAALQQMQSPQPQNSVQNDAQAQLYEALKVKALAETTKTRVETKLLLDRQIDTVVEQKRERMKELSAYCGGRAQAAKRFKAFDTRKKARLERAKSSDSYDSQESTCEYIFRKTAQEEELKAQRKQLDEDSTSNAKTKSSKKK